MPELSALLRRHSKRLVNFAYALNHSPRLCNVNPQRREWLTVTFGGLCFGSQS